MQKISFYLATNRIAVTTDTTGFSTENRKVYQRKLKLYKGIDNTIEFEVKNAEQRKVPVVGHSVMVKFYDATHRNLFVVQGNPIPNKLGLMTVIIPKEQLKDIDPQQLSIAAYLVDPNFNEKILYTDSQFGVLGSVELFDGYNDKFAVGDVIETIKRFNYDTGTQSYMSEIATFGTTINDDYSTDPYSQLAIDNIQVEIHNNPDAPYEGHVQVQATQDTSLAIGNHWDTIKSIDIGPFDGSTLVVNAMVYKTKDGSINGLERDYKYLRFVYHKADTGSNARFDITRQDGIYTVEIANGGVHYNIGDVIRILGSDLDGTSIANDLYIKVTAIDSLDRKKSISAIEVTGVAVPGSGFYRNRIGTNFTGSLDKIVIRN